MHSKQNYCIQLSLALAFGAVMSAAAVDLSKLPPASAQQNVTFAKDIKPLFEASCVRCHSGEKPKAGLRLDSLEAVLKGSKEGKVIEPGKSADSSLVVAVAQIDPETAMPPKPRAGRRGPGGPGAPGGAGGPPPQGMQGTNSPGGAPRGNMPPPKPLTAEQVGLVRAWVDQGAK